MQPQLRGWPVARVDEREPREVREQLSRRQEVLAQVPLFSGLPKKHLRKLARVSGVREYPEGTFIVREGEHGSMFYAVLSGQARVVRSRRIVAEVASVGFFGEISLLDGGPRAASVVATTDVRCVEIAGNDFVGVLSQDAAFAVQVLRGMARWLRGGGGPGLPVDTAGPGRRTRPSRGSA